MAERQFQLHLYNPHSDSNAVTVGEAPGMVFCLCGERHPIGMLAIHYETLKNVDSEAGEAKGLMSLADVLSARATLCWPCEQQLEEMDQQGFVRKWSGG